MRIFGVILFILFLLISFFINWNVKEEIRDTEIAVTSAPMAESPQKNLKQDFVPIPAPEKLVTAGDVLERTRVERGSDIIEHVFFAGNKEIARQTIAKDGAITQTGSIPDGKIKFINDYNSTYGEEGYRNNRKHGLSKTFFQDGVLKSEEIFKEGKLHNFKEFYPNGIIRLEVNYEDARIDKVNKKENKEVGIGKLYFPDGALRYEWNFTTKSPVAYRKAYFPDGQIRAESYYDEYGRFIDNKPQK